MKYELFKINEVVEHAFEQNVEGIDVMIHVTTTPFLNIATIYTMDYNYIYSMFPLPPHPVMFQEIVAHSMHAKKHKIVYS